MQQLLRCNVKRGFLAGSLIPRWIKSIKLYVGKQITIMDDTPQNTASALEIGEKWGMGNGDGEKWGKNLFAVRGQH